MKKMSGIKITLSLIITTLMTVFGFAAEFSLTSNTGEFILNCPIEVDIMINTRGQNITAADMIIKYEEKNIEVIGLTPGEFFSVNRGLQRDKDIVFSTAINYPDPIKGIGKFGTLTIIPKTIGTHDLEFVVDKIGKQETRDTNIAYQGKDYLLETKNIQIKVITGICLNTEVTEEGFMEYNTDMSYEEFEQERISKLNGNETESYINSLIEIAVIGLIIIIIIILIKRRSRGTSIMRPVPKKTPQ